VEDHGGRIWVEPAEPGCIFRFTLAAELQAEHSAA
jgi:signal transduction histidine kinase